MGDRTYLRLNLRTCALTPSAQDIREREIIAPMIQRVRRPEQDVEKFGRST